MLNKDRVLSMVSPLPNSAGASAGADAALQARSGKPKEASSKPAGETTADSDLQRLERSLEWLKRESMIGRLEAGIRDQKERRRVPGAGQLPPVSGFPPAKTDAHGQRRSILTLEVAPPRPSDSLQLPPPRRRRTYILLRAFCILVASAIVGWFAYHTSVRALLSTAEPAQTASLRPR
jgi:hypothetical protein